MNKFILVMVLLWGASCSSGIQPPKAVKNAFEKKFANATDIKWGKENAVEWEAEFKLDDHSLSANFSDNGAWIETETEIPISQLPGAVLESSKKAFPKFEIVTAEKIEHPDGSMSYETDLKSGRDTMEAVFKADGTLKN